MGRDNLGFFGEIHQGGLPSFSWLGSDLASGNRYKEEPDYIIIADHEADPGTDHHQGHQTDKMDYHHQPLAKVRKRHYDPVSYYEAVNDVPKTQNHDAAQNLDPSPHYMYEPVSYYEAQTPAPTAGPYSYEDLSQVTQAADDVSKTPDDTLGHQYVYDPYRHYQERTHRLQVSGDIKYLIPVLYLLYTTNAGAEGASRYGRCT